MDRQQAGKEIQDFFDGKRRAIENLSDPDIRRSFLADMNGIARDLEVRAMELADAGKEWKGIVGKAPEEFEKLRQEYLKRLDGDDPATAHNRELVAELKSL